MYGFLHISQFILSQKWPLNGQNSAYLRPYIACFPVKLQSFRLSGPLKCHFLTVFVIKRIKNSLFCQFRQKRLWQGH